MGNLHCLLHPKYSGQETPNLLCKACCSIYVGAIKASQVPAIEELASDVKESNKEAKASKKPSKNAADESFRAAEWLLKKSLESQKPLGKR